MPSRLRQMLLLLLGAGLLVACSADEQRAAQLLTEVQAAQANMKSATIDARMVVSAGGRQFTVYMKGGGYLKGPRAGDQHVSISMEGLPVPVRAEVVTLRGRGYVRMNGSWQSFPLPAQTATSTWTNSLSDLARYVKHVKVTENTVAAGVRGTTIAGDLDTAGLVRSMAQMNAFSGATGSASPGADEIAKHVGDTHVVLFISNRTHLVRSAVMSFEIKGPQTVKMELFISRTGVNRPVEIPTPS
jgi:hypothetical protein